MIFLFAVISGDMELLVWFECFSINNNYRIIIVVCWRFARLLGNGQFADLTTNAVLQLAQIKKLQLVRPSNSINKQYIDGASLIID